MMHAIAYPPQLDQLRALPRNAVHDLIEGLIASLDERDGDPDLELNGDERDGTGGEDDFMNHVLPWFAPGCPVADPGEQEVELMPVYGIDQAAPLNEVEAVRAWMIAQRRRDAS